MILREGGLSSHLRAVAREVHLSVLVSSPNTNKDEFTVGRLDYHLIFELQTPFFICRDSMLPPTTPFQYSIQIILSKLFVHFQLSVIFCDVRF